MNAEERGSWRSFEKHVVEEKNDGDGSEREIEEEKAERKSRAGYGERSVYVYVVRKWG